MSGHKSISRLRDELRAKPECQAMLQQERNTRHRRLVDSVGMLTTLRVARGDPEADCQRMGLDAGKRLTN